MKQLKINGHIIAELPDARAYRIENGAIQGEFLDFDLINGKYWYWEDIETLPSGHTYTLLGKVPELTTNQMDGFLENIQLSIGKIYRDYEEDGWLPSALQSLQSLLRSKGMNPNNSIVIKEN